jgi:uncharacterized protein (TIGR00730 family)
MKRVCVYCGSNAGRQPAYAEAAKDLARALVKRKIDLVYGGASVGMMGVLANIVLAAGGHVIGIMPQALVDREVAHTGLSELRVVTSMRERKILMAELSDGFIALPGGLGTLEEMFEILTWAQLGLHQKACGLLNICDYYRSLIDFLDHAVAEQFLNKMYRTMLLVEEEPERLLERFEGYRAPAVARWVDRASTSSGVASPFAGAHRRQTDTAWARGGGRRASQFQSREASQCWVIKG